MTTQGDYITVKQAFRIAAPYAGCPTICSNIGSNNYIDESELGSTIMGLGTIGYISTAGGGLSPLNLASTVSGLGYSGYVSSLSLTSTIVGLGSSDYISSLSLQSTVTSLVNAISTFVDPFELASTVTGLATSGFLSSSGIVLTIQSTVQGLGSSGYISSLSLQSTVAGLGSSGYISSLSLQSTVASLGSSGYLSSLSLTSTVAGLGSSGYLSSYSNVVFEQGLTSSLKGLGTLGYLSSYGSAVFQDGLTSSLQGLGSIDYVSSLSLQSTVTSLVNAISTFVDPYELASTVTGLATSGFLSSSGIVLTIQSTVAGLGSSGYLSSLSLTSTVAGLGSSGYLSSLSLTSTVAGLGSSGYLSSYSNAVFEQGLTSSLQGLGTINYVSSLTLQSTVSGLGSSGYLSSYGNAVFQLDLISSLQGLGTLGYLSTASASGISSLSTTVAYGVSTLSTTIGLQISSILSSFTTFARLGNTLTVDQVNGNDATASPSGLPYKTVNAAVSAVLTGDTIWVLPGTYNLTSPIVLPNSISIRGMSLQTTTIQMLNVTANTTLIIMGENTRVEDLTLKLTSQGHYALTGIEFGGTTTVTGKLRTCVLTVDNSNAPYNSGTSEVTAILASGTGTLGSASFSFNSLKGCTFNVYSNGAGKKRGVLVTGQNVMSTRDVNVYVAAPPNIASTGSYIGVETNNTDNLGSIQLRTTTVGTVSTLQGGAYTSSDIMQTTPGTIIDPTYLASAGIQVGPGVDLITKTAGNRGFSTWNYPVTIYYGIKSNVNTTAFNGYLWPGTQEAKAGTFPDSGTPPAYYRVQQPCLITGLSCGLGIAPGGTGSINKLDIVIKYTPVGGTIITTPFAVTLANSDLYKNFYDASVRLNTGDRLHVEVTVTNAGGGNANLAHDLTVQVDTF